MKKNVMFVKSLGLILASSLVIGTAPVHISYAALTQKLYSYTSASTVMVDDAKVKYVYNGKTVDLGKTPGILTSNTVAMAHHAKLFRDTLGLTTKYDSKKKTVTFSDGKKTLVLTLGSKNAKLDGKSVALNAVPMCAKYSSTGEIAVLVPSRFIAETFGFKYQWDSKTNTVTISKPLSLSYNNKTVSFTGTSGYVTYDGKSIDVKNLPMLIMDNTAIVQAYRVYKTGLGATYKFTRSTGTVVIKKGNLTLEMKLNSTKAVLNGVTYDCGVAPLLITNNATGHEAVMVPARFVSNALGYDYSYSDSTTTSQIKSSADVGVKTKLKAPSNSTASTSPSPGTSGSTGQTGTADSTDKAEKQYVSFKAEQAEELIHQIKESENTEKTYENPNGSLTVFQALEESPASNGIHEYLLHFSGPVTGYTASESGNKVTVTVTSTFCDNIEYALSDALIHHLSATSDLRKQTVSFVFESASALTPSYEIFPLEDSESIGIRFYPDVLSELTAGQKKDGEEYVTVKGLLKQKPEVTEDNDHYYLTFSGIQNMITESEYKSQENSNGNQISKIHIENRDNSETIITIAKPADTKSFTLTGNESGYEFCIQKKGPVVENTTKNILLPDNVKASMITDEDLYLKKQIVIKLSGDYRTFYEANPIQNVNDNVSSVKVSYSQNSTLITLTTKKIQGYEYSVSENHLLLTVDAPSKIYDRIVVLDAGHGGKDSGAISGSTYEKTVNYNVTNVYAKDYFKAAQIKVYYTRVDDSYVTLDDRAAFAKQTEADLFLSVHANATSSSAARGTMVFYSSVNKATNPSGLTSKKMAQELVNNLSAALNTKNMGAIDKSYVVVRDNTVPSVLIELGFLTNPQDKAIITSANGQKTAAKSICDTVVKLLNSYPTKR